MIQIRTPAASNFAWWFVALFIVTQVPLYWVQYPDIMDFPNHLARLHVLMHLPESETLQHYYALRKLQIGTNLAMEVVVPVLAGWVGAVLALKIFASLSILSLTTGAVALGRAVTGHVSYLQLGVLLFAQNAMFQLGLFNYLFGTGAAFWLLAAWFVFGAPKKVFHMIGFASGCVLVYLCHLSALGIYAVGVIAYELWQMRIKGGLVNRCWWYELALSLTQFLPVMLVHLVTSSSAGSYVPPSSEGMGFGVSIVYKALIVPLTPAVCVSGYQFGQAAFGSLLVIALYVGFRERALGLAVPARWMALSLTLAIILLPHAGFGSNLVDIRLLPAVGLFVWSGIEETGRGKLKPWLVLGLIATTVFFVSLETAWEWRSRDAEYRRVRNTLAQIPEGSRLAIVVLDKPTATLRISPHAGAWNVIDRSAFLSNFYVWPFQPFWVAYRDPYVSIANLARTDDPAAPPPEYQTLQHAYDYVLIFGADGAARLRYAPNAEAIYDSASLRLIRTGQDRLPIANSP